MNADSPALSGTPLRVFRTLPARVLGWVLVAAAAVLAGLTVWDVVTDRAAGLLGPVALVVGLATAGWVVFLRPSAVLYDDGVRLRNVVTDAVLPFGAVREVTHQWALELTDEEGTRHAAWAVPVRRELVRRRAIDDFAETTRRRGYEGVTAQGAADEVQRALQRWRLDGGEHPGAPTVATRTFAWAPVVLVVLTVALGVAALLP